jgi:predicted AlkP superfamily pyrophosphatase or phosphodiesterase
MRKVTAILSALALGACAYPYTPPALAPVTRPAGPATGALATSEARTPVTILVSIDGLRPDQLGRGDTPVLDALARGGVSAAMRPSFPTLTFPNHYTLVTGLRPDRHGVIDNTMEDARRPGVRFANTEVAQVRDGFWWDGAEPIWVTAERAGMRTATMFWPGSEAAIRGVRPSNWFAYAADLTSAQRSEAVLDWMRRPADTRPALATLYFDTVDKTSHNVGGAARDRHRDRWLARRAGGDRPAGEFHHRVGPRHGAGAAVAADADRPLAGPRRFARNLFRTDDRRHPAAGA